MARARKVIVRMLFAVLLLWAAGLFLFACDWLAPTSDRASDSAEESAAVAPAAEQEGAAAVDLGSTDTEEDLQGSGKGDAPVEGKTTDQDLAGESDGEGEEAGSGDLPPSGEGGEGEGDPLEEESFDSSVCYDTSYSFYYEKGIYAAELYRYISFDRVGVIYKVYVETEEIGTAAVSESAVLTFDCGFTDEVCALWGTWDSDGPRDYFVHFDTLDEYRAVLFRDELIEPMIQLDLFLEELDLFLASHDEGDQSDQETEESAGGETQQGSAEEHPSEIRCAECGAVMAEGGAHDLSCAKYAALPADSVYLSLLGEARGVWEDLLEAVPTSASAENYLITLNYLSAEGLAELRNTLTELSASGWITEDAFHLANYFSGGKICTINATLSEEQGVYSVRFDLRAYAVE